MYGRVAYRVSVRKLEGRRPLGTSRLGWEGNIKKAVQEWDGAIDWIDLAQNRDRWRALVNAVMILQVP
jgi:hypothetical protein